MEEWEKEYIERNLRDLIDNTNVGSALIARLISARVLGYDDVAELTKDGIDKNRKAIILYDTLKQRVNGYKILVEALEKENQTGAAAILKNLKQGFTKHSIKAKNEKQKENCKRLVSEAVQMSASKNHTPSNQQNQEQPEEEAVRFMSPQTGNDDSPGAPGGSHVSNSPLFPMLRKRKVIISGTVLLVILAAVAVVVAAITSTQKKGNTTNFKNDIQLKSSSVGRSPTNSTVPSTSVPVQIKNSDSSLKPPKSNYKKYTYVTILLAGPLTEYGTPKLILQLLDRDNTRLNCNTRMQQSQLGIVKYEAVGFSHIPTVSSPACADYDYRLVIMDVPVFQSGSRTVNWGKVDANTFASLKSYMDQCKNESFCDLFYLGFPFFWVDNTWTSRSWTNTDKQRLQEFLTSLRLFSKTAPFKIQNQVLLFEDFNNSGKQVPTSLRGHISTSILTMADNPFQMVNINPGLSSQPSNFWPFLQNHLPSSIKNKNLVEYSYFEKLRKGDELHCCFSKQLTYFTNQTRKINSK